MDNYHFYYLRRWHKQKKQIHPYITVCVKKNADGTVDRGVAVCSVKDNFERATGKAIAYNRCVSARRIGVNICPTDGRYNGFMFFGEIDTTPTKEEIRMLTTPAEYKKEECK